MEFERKRRIVILLTIIAVLYLSRNKLNEVKPISSINQKLVKYTPWKILLAGYTFHYFLSHALSIFGFGSVALPEQHYHPDFQNVRRVFTGLDAGIVSTLHIKPKWLRDILQIILGAYFILFPKKAEDRMHRFHQQATIEGIRACWCKGRHPLLWTITKFKEKNSNFINIHRRKIIINGSDGTIDVYLYFQGNDSELSLSKHCVINYPGGGFVTMNHLHHESYIQKWCNYLHIPFISVNYRKAPEHKYPSGFNDCYDTYKAIVDTNGLILGMKLNKNEKVKIVLTGDSAGGNFAAAVTCRAIVENIKIPDGLLLAYPVLDLNMSLFRPANEAIDFHRNYTNTIAKYSQLPQDIDKGDVLKSKEETPLRSYIDDKSVDKILRNAQNQLKEKEYNAFYNRPFDRGIIRNRGQSMVPLTSRVQYLNDGVLPIKYLLVLGEAYIPTNADPFNDMYLSPIKAPLNILSKFPTTRIHVGAVDPLVDDSRRFASLLKYANQNIDIKLLEWDGVSHAYIQCPTFLLPQARFSCEISVQWLSQMLNVKVVNPESFKYDYDKREKGLRDATDDLAFLRSRM